MGKVTELYRYPIKAHGREAITSVTLTEGQTMPWDRVWAVAHEATKFDPQNPSWSPCQSFTIGSKANGLQAITAELQEETGEISLTHPDLGAIKIDPNTAEGSAKLIDWTQSLVPENRARSSYLAKAPDRGMTDTDFPSISINSHASRRALSKEANEILHHDRFRANIWVDGFDAWEEFEWIGKTLRIGEAELEIQEPITRCRATTVDTKTGISNFDTLGLLSRLFDHQDFGVYSVVKKSGVVRTGDLVELI